MRSGRRLAASFAPGFLCASAPLRFNEVEINGTDISTSQSSAPAPAATPPPSAPPSSASRPSASTTGRTGKGKASLGGTCLNVGCIPSKALLESSENYERAMHKFAEHGITVEGVEARSSPRCWRARTRSSTTFTGGIALLFRKNKVASMHGHGSFVAGGEMYRIEVRDGERAEMIEAQHVIIATGSVARAAPWRAGRQRSHPRQRRRAGPFARFRSDSA